MSQVRCLLNKESLLLKLIFTSSIGLFKYLGKERGIHILLNDSNSFEITIHDPNQVFYQILSDFCLCLLRIIKSNKCFFPKKYHFF